MRVPLSWLREYIPLEKSNEEIADILTLAGLEVDAIATTPLSFSGVIVAEVIETEKHPEADTLKVAKVHAGGELLQIVCGAPNCRPGIRVALAIIGAQLKDGNGKEFKIKKGKLRGIESQGMLCGANELHLPGDNGGIMELDKKHPLGTPLEDLYGDTIFEISLTPNLGHCMSILGIARELSALTKIPIKQREIRVKTEEHATPFSVSIVSDDCRRYLGRKLSNVQVGPSPDWLVSRLENAGVRSINNVVDVTNYVMLELGQPMHAFDAALIAKDTIIVRNATESEELITLDEVKRHVPKGTLLIYDGVKPLAIAGVMGGISSSITEKTTTIILESANFDPSAVRRSSKATNLRSESSSRFEKGIDPMLQKRAIERASELLQEIANATIADEIIDIVQIPYAEKVIHFSSEKCNRLLGTQLTENEMVGLFARLDMTFTDGVVSIPSYRNDIHAEIDLVEEIARMYGYNNIPRKQPVYATSNIPHSNMYLLEKDAREKCISLGLQEFLTCDLISPKLTALTTEGSMNEDALIPVLQPSSVDQSILRTSLMPGMLTSIKHNFDHGMFDISAFEIGKIHFKEETEYKERSTCALMLTGLKRKLNWKTEQNEVDFFTLKGYIENLLESIGIPTPRFIRSSHHSFHPGIQASIQCGEVTIGVLGEVHPRHAKTLDISKRIYYAQLDLEDMLELRTTVPQMKALPQFPGSDRDWTVTMPKQMEVAKLLGAIRNVPSKLLKEVDLRGVYESEKLGKDKKNVTLRFFYRNDTKTVQQESVEKEHARITQAVSTLFHSP